MNLSRLARELVLELSELWAVCDSFDGDLILALEIAIAFVDHALLSNRSTDYLRAFEKALPLVDHFPNLKDDVEISIIKLRSQV